MEIPQPQPEDQRIQDKEEAHKISLIVNDMRDEILNRVDQEHIDELERVRREAKRTAMTDAMTGLANPAALSEALPSAENDLNVAIVAFDGDNFGSINKEHHQSAGNAAIIVLANAIREAAEIHGTNRVFRGEEEIVVDVQGSNRVFRGGGDEFYILCDPSIADAIIADAKRLLAERIASGEPLLDDLGNPYPSEWYTQLGLTGSWGQTRIEADTGVQGLKKAKKANNIDIS